MIYGKRRGLFGRIIKPLLVLAIVFLVFSTIWFHTKVTAYEYELGQLQRQKIALIKERRELVAKRAQMLSLKKVQYLAADRLGLVYPDRKRVFFVRSDRGPTPYTTGLRKR
ncbi:MAG TPA: hypothetical protein ENJ04_08590 [Nitrospirae bacterium]|nr:hypothetical protein [Nitrospirota bacterium]